MKNLNIRTSLFISLFLIINYSFAGTFTSNGMGGGNWNSPTSWISQNDADGIPDMDDDINVIAGDIITWDINVNCNNLYLFSGSELACFNGKNLLIQGNYHNSGTESGNGYFQFDGINKTISGDGSFSPSTKWIFKKNTIINNDVIAVKNGWTYINNGAIITNKGDIELYGLIKSGTTVGKWINHSGSVLRLKSHLVTVKLDASTYENTIKTIYSSSNARLPVSINNKFHHLEIGASTKFVNLLSDITINGNLTIETNGKFNMNGYNIHLKGTFENYQTFLQPDNSSLFMDGTSPQNLNSFTEPTKLSNLVIDNASGVLTGGYGKFTISKSLVVAEGEFDLGKNKITLLSDSTKTAYIGSSNGTMIGTMTIQRFISNRNDGFSDLSSPVHSALFYELTDDLDLAFNAYIPNFSSPSCWSYNESSLEYLAVETFNDTLIPGHGYKVYLDNDGDSSTSFIGTIVDIIGTPNTGNISIAVTSDNDGWNLIGNPYASSISWTEFRNNAGLNMNAQFRYYDETTEGFSYGNDGDSIAAGQGFWIQVTQTGNVTFHESNKVTSTNSTIRMADTTEDEKEEVIEKSEWVKINPTLEGIELEILTDTDENISVSVFNLAGQEIASNISRAENDNIINIRLPETANGIYIIHIINGNKFESKKIYHN